MNDCELLDLAAKAAGHHVRYVSDGKGGGSFFMEPSQLWWNPLTDDGDALRLAVKLGMRVSANRDPAGFTAIASVQSPFGAKSATESADPETLSEATRRAIVRAAAEIVKNR